MIKSNYSSLSEWVKVEVYLLSFSLHVYSLKLTMNANIGLHDQTLSLYIKSSFPFIHNNISIRSAINL